jgi:hypothetical protein
LLNVTRREPGRKRLSVRLLLRLAEGGQRHEAAMLLKRPTAQCQNKLLRTLVTPGVVFSLFRTRTGEGMPSLMLVRSYKALCRPPCRPRRVRSGIAGVGRKRSGRLRVARHGEQPSPAVWRTRCLQSNWITEGRLRPSDSGHRLADRPNRSSTGTSAAWRCSDPRIYGGLDAQAWPLGTWPPDSRDCD